MKIPIVSIVIPTYDRAQVLSRAVDSVVAQTWEDWELILIDDGSTDATAELAEHYAERLGPRFIYRQQENQGCCHARNHGINIAQGEYVAFLDSDDAWAPTKLQRQLELFRLCPDLGLVFSDYTCVDLNGRVILSAFDHFSPIVRSIPTTEVAPNLHKCHGLILDYLLRRYFIATIIGLVRKSTLGQDIRFNERPSYAHEWLFFLQVVNRAAAGFVDEPLAVHYFTPGSITRTDPQRNLIRLYRLLTEMRCTLGPLRWNQRRTIAHHANRAARQLASSAYRRGDFAAAARWFLRALKWNPNPRNVFDALDAALHRLGQGIRRIRAPDPS